MGDLANVLDTSLPFMSAVENGKKNVPSAWIPKIIEHYNLNSSEIEELNNAVEESKTQMKLNLINTSGEKRIAALQFARSFEDMDDETARILKTAHPRGGTKAKFFIETLGYSKSNSKEFYDNLAEAIDKKIPSKVTRTQYGIVCEFREKIKGVNGKYEYANIIASIQKDDGKEKYRILTVYPGKKEKK